VSARSIVEAVIVEFHDEAMEDYSRVRDDVIAEWDAHQEHQSWSLVPKNKLIRLYNEYGKYGRINENLLLDVWTILHDTAWKVVINSETRHNDDWPYGQEPELFTVQSERRAAAGQSEFGFADPRREVRRPLSKEQIEQLKEKEWDRWFLFVSDLSGSQWVRNFGEVKGNARYSDAVQSLTKLLDAAYAAEEPGAKLLAIDRLLNFVHGLGQMAKWFVEGGKATLDQIANYAPKGITAAGFR